MGCRFLGSGVKWPTAMYMGWFGPRGLASLLFLLFVLEGFAIEQSNTVFELTVATIFLSVVAHGLTARSLTRIYGRWIDGLGQCPERKQVSVLRTWLKAKTD